MPQFEYQGDTEMVFVEVTDPTTGGTLAAKPGNVYELLENPDDQLFKALAAAIKKAAASAAEDN